MDLRLRQPDLTTAVLGRVYAIHYREPITLDCAQRAQQDFQDRGQAAPLVLVIERPFPLPSTEVRAHWLVSAETGPTFEGIALVVPRSSGGRMTSAVGYLGEQLMAARGVTLRLFWDVETASRWLVEKFECGLEADELGAGLEDFIDISSE